MWLRFDVDISIPPVLIFPGPVIVLVLPFIFSSGEFILSSLIEDTGVGADLPGENGTSSSAGDSTETLCVGLGAVRMGNMNGADTAVFRWELFEFAAVPPVPPPLLSPVVDNDSREDAAGDDWLCSECA